jgi:branched-chain amino acid aminotransferase
VILTPGLAHSALAGITRDTVIRLAREAGIEVRETSIPRELLYLADELFFTGTAVEVTPIRSVDRIPIGTGRRGPITERLQKTFFGLFSGATSDKWGWLDYVDMQAKPRVAAAS